MRFFLILGLYARLVIKVEVIAKKPKKKWNDCLLVYLIVHDSPSYRTLLAFSATVLKITLSFVAWSWTITIVTIERIWACLTAVHPKLSRWTIFVKTIKIKIIIKMHLKINAWLFLIIHLWLKLIEILIVFN